MSVVIEKPLSGVPLGVYKPMPAIGAKKWKDKSVRGMNLADQVKDRCDDHNVKAKALDTFAGLREECILKSNTTVHQYCSEVRVVVTFLRRSFADTNEEIKYLTNCKAEVEKHLEHIRKDIKLNQNSKDMRSNRPKREMVGDGADKLLAAERKKLLQIKKEAEHVLKSAKDGLEALRVARDNLSAQLSERTRVMDLMCHSYSVRPTSTAGALYGDLPKLNAKPLGPYTPQARDALISSRDLRVSSALLRADIKAELLRSMKSVSVVHTAVNMGITQKSQETKGLASHLTLKLGEQRAAMYRAQRQGNRTELAYESNMGPKSTEHLAVSEKLNRPLLKVYHRHPGTEVTEGQDVTAGAKKLFSSLQASNYNIKLNKAAQEMLLFDLTDKKTGAYVDNDVLRLRRRRANHKWIMGPPSLYVQ